MRVGCLLVEEDQGGIRNEAFIKEMIMNLYYYLSNFIFCLLMVSLGIVFIHGGIQNVFLKRLSKYSLDAIAILFVRVYSGKKAIQEVKNKILEDQKLLYFYGIFAIINGILLLYRGVKCSLNFLFPLLQ